MCAIRIATLWAMQSTFVVAPRRLAWIAMASFVGWAGAGFVNAQDAPSSMAPAQTDEVDDALSGPKVSDAADSLVRMNMEGKLERLSMRPEQAAAERIVMDQETRDRVRQVLDDHAQAMRRLIIENIDLFVADPETIKANDGNAVRRVIKDLHAKWESKDVRDPLLPAFEAAMSSEQIQQVRTLVDEYWKAVLDAEVLNATKDRKKQPTEEDLRKAREQAQGRLLLEQFRREVTAAYESTLRPVQRRLDNICTAVAATDEQRQEIRGVLIKFARDGKLPGDASDKANLAREIYNLLDEPQRLKMVEAAVGGM